MLKELMQTTNFRVTVVEESDVVEICGALKVRFCPPLKGPGIDHDVMTGLEWLKKHYYKYYREVVKHF